MLHTPDISRALTRPRGSELKALDVSRVLAAGQKRVGRRRLATVAGIGVALVLVAAGVLWWSGVLRPASPIFLTDTVTRGNIEVTLVATGTLNPTKQVSVLSTNTGTIASIDVEVNDHVVRGQPLAHLDMSDLEAQLARARALVDVQEANVLTATAGLSDAEAALKRAQKLGVGDIVSQRELDMAETAEQRARAGVSSASAQLEVARADLQVTLNNYAHGTITSPIDGIVLTVNADVGQYIGTASLGQALFVVAADLKKLDLEVDIDEADVAQVSESDHVVFTVEAAPNTPYEGSVRQLRSAPTVIDGIVNYKALISVDNAAMSLRPGMTATAAIRVARLTGVLTLANAALRYIPHTDVSGSPFAGVIPKSTVETSATDNHTVWVLAGGQPTPVSVVTGLTDGQRTQIVSGDLHEGDAVITGTKGP